MFSSFPERTMLSVRGLLLIAWFILIGSLFYDPVSVTWTQPDAAGPFAISTLPVKMQGEVLVNTPYAMGSRLFWTMIVPILPLFLMVFGHEAWRRLCPLSLASQIPGYLGFRRKKSSVERRTGMIKRTIPVISPNGWLERNSWYVQFALLFAGITARLLLINTDRYALALALLSVIVAAMVTGVLWGGKTWCNYFCPANIVQKIYTEPRGIFESSPQFSRPSLPQSMCRKPTKKGDISACVACKTNCGDIDLQRSYWNGVTDKPRRDVYYMFLGLIIGFYGFYYLYSGSWDYYFSGIWTHEDNVHSKILGPGLYVFGQSIAIPKLITAPGILALACGLSLVIGRGFERLYRHIRKNDTSITEQLLVHHCLCVSAWLSINAFYLFGGRPNILLLPSLSGRIVDIVIVSLTTIWLRQALLQSPERYQQEGMAAGLLKQLKKLKLDGTKIPGDKSIDSLRPSEIYLLANMLPAFSHKEKTDAYRKMLEEQIAKGATGSQTSMKIFEDFRNKMNITEEEHSKILDDLGYNDGTAVQTVHLTAEEKATSIAQYRNILESTVAKRIETGETVSDILSKDSVKSMLTVLRQSLQISDSEHDASLESLFAGGVVSEEMEGSINALVRHKSLSIYLESGEMNDRAVSPLLDFLLEEMEAREELLLRNALAVLRNFPATDEMYIFAEDLAALGGARLKLLLRQHVSASQNVRWHQVFAADVLEKLQGVGIVENTPEIAVGAHRKAISGSANARGNLLEALSVSSDTLRAAALLVFSKLSPLATSEVARDLARYTPEGYPLLHAAILHVTADGQVSRNAATKRQLVASVKMGGEETLHPIEKHFTRIGSASENDLVIRHPSVEKYHAILNILQRRIEVSAVGSAILDIDGVVINEGSFDIRPSSVIKLGSDEVQRPELVLKIVWMPVETPLLTPIERLIAIAHVSSLRALGAEPLAALTLGSEGKSYVKDDCIELNPSSRLLIVHSGSVEVGSKGANRILHSGMGLDSMFVMPAEKITNINKIVVISDHAVLLKIPLDDGLYSYLTTILNMNVTVELN